MSLEEAEEEEAAWPQSRAWGDAAIGSQKMPQTLDKTQNDSPLKPPELPADTLILDF